LSETLHICHDKGRACNLIGLLVLQENGFQERHLGIGRYYCAASDNEWGRKCGGVEKTRKVRLKDYIYKNRREGIKGPPAWSSSFAADASFQHPHPIPPCHEIAIHFHSF
jgi:hypothetical protein